MSKKSGLEKRGKANEEERNFDAHEGTSSEKAKLLHDIKALRLLIRRIENKFEPMTFKDICKDIRQIDSVVKTARENFGEPIDVEVELRNDLYAFAGLSCTKIDKEIVFAFQSFEKNFITNSRWIQLAKVDERWELRRWVMPISIDVGAVMAKYSIDSAASMKLFLRECKHLLDCYNHRENEFRELKAFSESLDRGRCFVDSNYGYTQITIRLARAGCPSPDEGRNVLVYLVYRASEARPSKLLIDCDGESKLSDEETRNLRALFRSLRERDLRDAMEKILASEGNPFVGTEATEENSANDSAGTEDEEAENNLSKMLKMKARPAKKRVKVAAERDENDNEVNEGDERRENEVSEDDDRRENDLSIDAAHESNVPSTGRDARGSKKAAEKKKSSPKKKTSRKPKAASKPKTTRAGKKNLPLKDRNDNESNVNPVVPNDERVESSKNDEKFRSTVPEMFKPRTKKSTTNSAKAKALETPKLLHGEKPSFDADKSAVNSVKRAHRQLMCSTPIVGRTLALSAVAEENISVIDRESTTIAQEVAATENRDASDSSESDGEDATRIENSQRELLKELRAVKETKVAPRKPAKRKAKSPAKGRKKIARK